MGKSGIELKTDLLSYDSHLSDAKAWPEVSLIINVAFGLQSGLKLEQIMNQHG